MKKAVILLIMLMILTACATQETKESKAKEIAEQLRTQTEEPIQETPETITGAVTTEPETTETQQTTVKPTEIEAPTAGELIKGTDVDEIIVAPAQGRTQLYKFLDTFAQKVKSYEFTQNGNKYSVKGTKYKIQLANAQTVKDVTFGEITKSLYYYDTIYMDKETQTATAYCEGHKSQINTQCSQLEIYDLAYPADYNKYNIKLPEDWLLQYLNEEPDQIDENKYYIEGKRATAVRYHGTPELEIDIEQSTGMVIRVDEKKGDQLIKRIDFSKLATNLVRDVDLHHRTKAEIPTSDVFYK